MATIKWSCFHDHHLNGHPCEGGKIGKLLAECEIAVLRLVAVGTPVKAISKELGITKGSVRNYTYRARKKLGATSTTHAVAIAMQIGLLQIEINLPERESIEL